MAGWDLSDVNLAGEDLTEAIFSGATWCNGCICANGSVGHCNGCPFAVEVCTGS